MILTTMRASQKQFLVNRDEELEVITRFLTKRHGGSLLVGGDRGSGKTTLVNLAADLIADNPLNHSGRMPKFFSKLRNLTISRTIRINIPLIILETSNNGRDISENYRSLLMRSMLIGMESDLLRRYNKYYSWFDLPLRWFRSIGYVQRVSSMKSYTNYLTLSKTTSKALSATGNLFGVAAVNTALTAEIDLSDSSLEIKLRDLLDQYSSIHRFIFIFDELDKLPEAIPLEKVVLYLKNLFTETGAYGIFITDELALKRVLDKAELRPPTESTTLFIEHVLLNNMTRDEYAKVMNSRVKMLDNKMTNTLVAVTSLRTRRSPHELSKLFVRHGFEYAKIIEGMKSELGEQIFYQHGVMQLFVDYVYQKFPNRFGAYFNRNFIDVLTKVGEILIKRDSLYVSRNKPWEILYTSNFFKETGLSEQQWLEKERIYKLNGNNKPNTIPSQLDWLSGINDERLLLVRNAIECLITLLNRCGYLDIESTSEETIFKLKPVNTSSTDIETLELNDFEKIFELSKYELHLLDLLNKYSSLYKGITHEALYNNVNVIDQENINDIRHWGKYSLANLKPQWQKIEKIIQEAPNMILGSLLIQLRTINSILVTSYEILDNSIIITVPSATIQLSILIESDKFVIHKMVDKIFVLRSIELKKKTENRNPKVKYLNINLQDIGIGRELEHIAQWIKANQ